MSEVTGAGAEPVLDVITIGRSSVDLYGQQIGTRLEDWRIRYPYYFLGQSALSSPTVFNFYLPSYMPRGELVQSQLVAPEFQILTDGYLTAFANELGGLAFWTWQGNSGAEPEWLKVDFNRYYALSTNPEALVDELDVLLMGGRMSGEMYDILLGMTG